MNRATAIARREFLSYFRSPIAYVALTLFLLISGLMFRGDFVPGQPAAMRTILNWMVWLLVFIIPVLYVIVRSFLPAPAQVMEPIPNPEGD